jgi:hypothetical protein
MRSTPLFAALAAAILIAAPASARTWQQDWSVGAHPGVIVNTNDARVRIHRGAPGRITASIEYTINVWGFHTQVQDPVIELSRAGDVVTVTARARSNAFFFGGMNERFHIDVTLPPACDVQVRSGDGAVDLAPVTGTIDLQTGDGHITAHGATGKLRFWTGDGGIDADSLDGAVEARTGDGHLKVEGRFDRLDLRAGDGRVTARIHRGSQLTEAWNIQTGDGGVVLFIPRNLQALLDMSASDGSMHVDLPISGIDHRSHHELRGQLNGGTVPLRVHTGDGSVSIGLSE